MKNFILYCIVFFTATSICAFAYPPTMHGGQSHHIRHHNHRYHHSNHFSGHHRMHPNENFHVYENTYQRRNSIPSYCYKSDRLNSYNSLCNPKRRLMPTHTLPFYGTN